MIVILNNGSRIKIEKNVAQNIIQNMIKGDVKNWQLQVDGQNSMAPVSALNLNQVAAICAEEDIQTGVHGLVAVLDIYKDSLPNKDESGKFWCDKFREFLLSSPQNKVYDRKRKKIPG